MPIELCIGILGNEAEEWTIGKGDGYARAYYTEETDREE